MDDIFSVFERLLDQFPNQEEADVYRPLLAAARAEHERATLPKVVAAWEAAHSGYTTFVLDDGAVVRWDGAETYRIHGAIPAELRRPS